MIGKAEWSGGPEQRGGLRRLARAVRVFWVKNRGAFARPAVGVALLAACSHASKPTAPGCCEKSGQGGADDGGADAAAPLASAPAKPPPKFRVEDGCARDFKSSGDASGDLKELERLCAQGLAPVLESTETTRVSSADGVSVAFRVTGSTACLRAGAVGIAPGQLLSLENARGTVLAAATTTDTVGLVPADGTVCVREAGAYRFVLKAPPWAEARTLSVQVWAASRD